MARCGSLLLLAIVFPILFPSLSASTTANDLRSRMAVDGRTGDFAADEWIVDPLTPVREPAADSRWGADNDIRAVALTWDTHRLYVAVRAVAVSTHVMLYLDTVCGGVSDPAGIGVFRRAIRFGGMSPNLIVMSSRLQAEPRASFIDCDTPFREIDPGAYDAVFFQDAVADDGAFEIALPWTLLGPFERIGGGVKLPARGWTLSVLAVITGGAGTGAGDAAPDPTVLLENDSTRVAVLDNHVVLPLDGDADGMLDIGVSPRAIAGFATAGGAGERARLPLHVGLDRKAFSPDKGETLRFRAWLSPADNVPNVYLSARIFTSAGRLVRTLFTDEPRNLSSGAAVSWDEWDGRDDHGDTVRGGIHVLAVSGGPARGAVARTVKSAFAVIR